MPKGFRPTLFAQLVATAHAQSWVPAALHPITGRPASPPPLPGLKPTDDADQRGLSARARRRMYRGKHDRAHLGGFTDLDVGGLSPSA